MSAASTIKGPGTPDARPHSSVQAWSRGALFPAVIARVERYSAAGYDFPDPVISFELTIGAFREEYATREDAEAVARWTVSGGRIIPERYAQLVPGAGRSMAAFGAAMAPDVRPEDILAQYPGERCDLRAIPCDYWRGVCTRCSMPDFGGKGGAS